MTPVLGRKLAGDSMPVLMYHEIADGPATRGFRRFIVPPALFAEHLAAIREAGYLTGRVSQIPGVLEQPPTVFLTFDDGFATVFELALPAMARLGMTATLFLPTAHMGGHASWLNHAGEGHRRLASWADARDAALAGFEIGSHGSGHVALDVLAAEGLAQELSGSREILEDETGSVVRSLAYPYGYSNRSVRLAARHAGYAAACEVGYGLHRNGGDTFRIRRLPVGPGMSAERLLTVMIGSEPSATERIRLWSRPAKRLNSRATRYLVDAYRGHKQDASHRMPASPPLSPSATPARHRTLLPRNISVNLALALQAGKHLPPEVFAHMGPTTIACLDLEDGAAPVVMSEGAQAGLARDAVVLVRLHSEPLGLLYVDSHLQDLTSDDLSQTVWRRFSAEIAAHAARAQCMAVPARPLDLAQGLQVGLACPESQPAPPTGSVAVIVPTRGRSDRLGRCLESLTKLRGLDYEIVVVDNDPPCQANAEIVNAAGSRSGLRITYLEEPRPGSSVARNCGIAHTRADIVAFTDDDVVVDHGWLGWLIEPFRSRDVGATTGMALPLELETASQKRFEQLAGSSKGVVRRAYDLRVNRPSDRLLYPFWGAGFGAGNSCAFRRMELVAAGGFDPALGVGSLALAGADIEALSAVVLRGKRLVYEPRSVCWHENRGDDNALERQLFSFGVGCGAILTKSAVSDWRFLGALAKSAPLALDLWRQRFTQQAGPDTLAPPELVGKQWSGMLRGPARYARSRIWSRQLGLDRVVRGG